MSTVVPKLVNQDRYLFESLLQSAFPGCDINKIQMDALKDAIRETAAKLCETVAKLRVNVSTTSMYCTTSVN